MCEDILIDFIIGLPRSHGFTAILVAMDRFSKRVHLGDLPSHFTAYKVAELLISIVCKHHAFPRSIVYDRHPLFISNFWKQLFKLSDTVLRMSSYQ